MDCFYICMIERERERESMLTNICALQTYGAAQRPQERNIEGISGENDMQAIRFDNIFSRLQIYTGVRYRKVADMHLPFLPHGHLGSTRRRVWQFGSAL
jgi:hypothetical protein